jgi:acyl-coenzyme A synthetase/AMP-(fatty) acid ligase
MGRGGAFRDGWFYPGDLGRIEEDGLVVVTGRSADAVNIGGKKLSIADVENKLLANPALPDLCVIPVHLAAGDLLAIVVAAGEDQRGAPLQAEIGKAIPKGISFRIVRTPAIPRNEAGKVARQALARRLTEVIGKG